LKSDNGRRFYIDFERKLNNAKIRRARFLFLQYGIFFDFQTEVRCWSYIAEVMSGGKVQCAIRERAEHRLDVLFEVLLENKNKKSRQ
jgi:hypothetical protein